MGLICDCPLAASLPDVPLSDCPDSFGQIQKVIFQRLESAAGVKNVFTSPDKDITKKASWTALLEASDGTKVVVSPYITAPTTEPVTVPTAPPATKPTDPPETEPNPEPSPITGTAQVLDVSEWGVDGELYGYVFFEQHTFTDVSEPSEIKINCPFLIEYILLKNEYIFPENSSLNPP